MLLMDMLPISKKVEKNDGNACGCHEYSRTWKIIGRNDQTRQSAYHFLYRRQPRRRYHELGGPFTLQKVPNYRDLSPKEEWELLENHYNRVTDTCIPEEKHSEDCKNTYGIFGVMRRKVENGSSHEFMYQMLLSGVLEQYYEIDPKNSWMLAAAEKNIPIVVPGWEDSTMGNIFASYCIKGQLKAPQ